MLVDAIIYLVNVCAHQALRVHCAPIHVHKERTANSASLNVNARITVNVIHKMERANAHQVGPERCVRIVVQPDSLAKIVKNNASVTMMVNAII